VIFWVMGGTLVGVLVAEVLRRQHYQARLDATGEAGDLEAPLMIRFLDRGGVAGRWRAGSIRRQGASLEFRPRPPRPGPNIDLTGAAITGTRPARGRDRMWSVGATVLQGDGPAGRFEIITGGGVTAELASRVLGYVEKPPTDA
jgi:hypothetical protein